MERRTTASPAAHERIAVLEEAIATGRAALDAERDRVASLTSKRDRLRVAYELLQTELELLRRRLFVAKAERVDTRQIELEFAEKLAEVEQLAGTSGLAEPKAGCGGDDDTPAPGGGKKKPTGRRDLRKVPLDEERIEIPDPLFDELVAAGKAERIGHEESCKLAWKRGGLRRLVLARVKYRAVNPQGAAEIEMAPMPPECFPRSLAAPSLLAKILVD